MSDKYILFCFAEEDQDIAEGFLRGITALGIAEARKYRVEDLPNASVVVALVPVIGAQVSDLLEDLKQVKREKMAAIGLLVPGVSSNNLKIVTPYIDYLASETIYSSLIESLSKHLSQFYSPRRPILETKMIVVGEGSVGKTSLINRILGADFDVQERMTDGIAIHTWSVKVSNNQDLVPNRDGSINLPIGPRDMKVLEDETVLVESEVDVRVNIWDFGGQEIMHATHQFFLTERCLYLLVVDARLTPEENRVEYWLKIIQILGGKSPVIIVGNKIDQQRLHLDESSLQRMYENLVDIRETSAANNVGIVDLIMAIKLQIGQLRHVWKMFPEECFQVRSKLEELGKKRNFITLDQYNDLCEENDLTDVRDRDALIRVLHDLGAVLHFQDDPRLESLGVLHPQWVTDGVYKIINSSYLSRNKGVLERSMLDTILNVLEYPDSKRIFIINIMRKFELCYEIETDNTYLIPGLLPMSEPSDLDFSGFPAFEYLYPILPSSIIARFIVRINQNIIPGCVWRTGVLLRIGENTILVRASSDARKITIAVGGRESTRRDVLSVIRYELDSINTALKGLVTKKRVPIPQAPDAEPLDYDFLLQLEQDGIPESVPVSDGGRRIDVNISQLLNGVASEAKRKEDAKWATNVFATASIVDSNMVTGAEIFISYARMDLEIVREIYEVLRNNNYHPWMDVYSIKGGQDWLRTITKAIDDCEIFLAILSNHSVSRRGAIQKELKRALDKWEGMLPDDIYIIPIRIDDCPLPDLLKHIQVLEWESGKGALKLLEAIRIGLASRQFKS